MLILGIESSCDETAAAVVRMEGDCDRREILSNAVASQIAIHRLYGGVVPEIAGRAHAEAISPLVASALSDAGVTVADLDAIGVTYTPGLIGALLVGVNFAKGLAFSAGKPLVPVHHIRGHIAANYFALSGGAPEEGTSDLPLKPPFFALVASGGHTSLVRVRDWCEFETVGRTRDDAMGEAFDKVARVMGIPYPGGAEMDRLAAEGDPRAIRFPDAALHDGSLDFSFSGLKTAVINHLHTAEARGESISRSDVAASFTAAVIRSVEKQLEAAWERDGFDRLVLAGGCSANSHLRGAVKAFCRKKKIALTLPPRALCGDNGVMIAAQAYYEYRAGHIADTSLNAEV